MRAKTKSTTPDQGHNTIDPIPSPNKLKTLLGQVCLQDAIEQLTDLRKTMRLHALSLDEFLQKASLPPAVVSELLATIQRRDRECASRLASVRTFLTKASRLLIQPEAQPADPK